MSSPLLWGPSNTSNNLQNQILLANGQLLSNNGPKNYIKNNNFENGLTTGWSLGNVSLTSNFPSGTPTFGSGSAGALVFGTDNTEAISGTYSLYYTSVAFATTAGNFLASNAFTIDKEDQAKVLSFKFSYKLLAGTANMSGTSANSFGVAIYDVTNSQWIQPAGVYNIVQSSGVGQSTGTFQTSSNGTQYRFLIYNANATPGAVSLILDNFFVGPQVTSIAPAMSDWRTFTPTGSWTSNTTYTGRWRRVGENAEIEYGLTISGTPTNTALILNLPSGLVIDTTKLFSTNVPTIGIASIFDGATVYDANPLYNNTTSFYVTSSSSTLDALSQFSNTVPFTWNNGDSIKALINVPITGWSSNTVSSADTDTRVVAARFNTSSSRTFNNTQPNVVYETVQWDTHGAYNNSTGTYTIPVSGYYRISAGFVLNAVTATLGHGFILTLKRNGSGVTSIAATRAQTTSSVGPEATGSTQYFFNAGDTLTLGGYADTATTTVASASINNWVSIERISGPAVVQATETVAARYITTAGQSIPNSSATIINFGTQSYDSHSAVTVGASWKFTAPVSGKYSVKVGTSLASASMVNTAIIDVNLRKNGSNVSSIGWMSIQANNTMQMSTLGSDTISLLAGDYIDVTMFQNNGGARSLSTDSRYNFIAIERVGN